MRQLTRNGFKNLLTALLILLLPIASAAQTRRAPAFDVIIRGGTVYDGTGGPARRADVGIRGDRIAAIGHLKTARAATVIDATGLAVAPESFGISRLRVVMRRAGID